MASENFYYWHMNLVMGESWGHFINGSDLIIIARTKNEALTKAVPGYERLIAKREMKGKWNSNKFWVEVEKGHQVHPIELNLE